MCVIEFLNEKMSSAEVLGVELQQFAQGERVACVPRVVGQTNAAATSWRGSATGLRARGPRPLDRNWTNGASGQGRRVGSQNVNVSDAKANGRLRLMISTNDQRSAAAQTDPCQTAVLGTSD